MATNMIFPSTSTTTTWGDWSNIINVTPVWDFKVVSYEDLKTESYTKILYEEEKKAHEMAIASTKNYVFPDHPVMNLYPYDPQFLAFINSNYPTAKVLSSGISSYNLPNELSSICEELTASLVPNVFPVTRDGRARRINRSIHITDHPYYVKCVDLYPSCHYGSMYDEYRAMNPLDLERLISAEFAKAKTHQGSILSRRMAGVETKKINQFDLPDDAGLVLSYALFDRNASSHIFRKDTPLYIINLWYLKQFMYYESFDHKMYHGPIPHEGYGYFYEVYKHGLAHHGIDLKPNGYMEFKFATPDGRYITVADDEANKLFTEHMYVNYFSGNGVVTKAMMFDTFVRSDVLSGDMFGFTPTFNSERVNLTPAFKAANPLLAEFIDHARSNSLRWKHSSMAEAQRLVARNRITRELLDSHFLNDWTNRIKLLKNNEMIEEEWGEGALRGNNPLDIERLGYRSRLGSLIAS